MTQEEFAKKIRAKYPNGVTSDGVSYSELTDEDLTNRIVSKYPVYQSQIGQDGQQETQGGGFMSSVKESFKKFGEGVSNAFSSRKENIKAEVQGYQDKKESGTTSAFNPIDNPRLGLRVTGQVAGGVNDVTGELFKLLAPKFVEDFMAKAGGKVMETDVAQAAVKKYDDFKQKYPEAAKDLESWTNIGLAAADVYGATATTKAAYNIGKQGVSKISKVTGQAIDSAKAARIASKMDDIDSVVGRIIQGKPDDIAVAKRSLATIDTKGVKTVGDLGDRIDDTIEALANKVDNTLDDVSSQVTSTAVESKEGWKAGVKEQFDYAMINKNKKAVEKLLPEVPDYYKAEFKSDIEGIVGKNIKLANKASQAPVGEVKNTFKSADLVKETKVGSKVVKQSFVDDALDDLDELYMKIKDEPARAEIALLKEKLKTEGLTVRELNDLSRKYGQEFSSKAFSKATGDPLTSVNAQAFENTRKGIKEAVRSKLPDKTVQLLDERMSDLYKTRDLVNKLNDKVVQAYQKVKQKGLFENIANKAAGVIDAASLKTISGFMSKFMPKFAENMSYIDIEKALAKNLKELDKLLKTTKDEVLEDTVVKYIRGLNQK